jgi:signal transduction histidine kinase
MYLDEVIDDVARSSRVLASAKQLAIETHSVGSAAFDGDEDLMRRMIGNLVDNAIRHAPARSTVRVELRREGRRYQVLVRDGGPGIPVEVQSRIFERFYRLDAARPYDGGAGLGLALARWIARQHGGDVILLDSSDAGTTFMVELPGGDS